MCACCGLPGVSSCHYTDCKCAAGLVAVLLGLQGAQLSGCVCVCAHMIAGCAGVLWHRQPYSNLFSLSNYSLVKQETKALVPPSSSSSPSAPAERVGSKQAQHGFPQPQYQSCWLDILSTRGQPAPRSGIACFVLPHLS